MKGQHWEFSPLTGQSLGICGPTDTLVRESLLRAGSPFVPPKLKDREGERATAAERAQ